MNSDNAAVGYSPALIAIGVVALSFSKFLGALSGVGNLIFYGSAALAVASILFTTQRGTLSLRNLAYLAILTVISFCAIPVEWLFPIIETSMPSYAAVIGPYNGLSQVLSGLFYDLRAAIFLFLFYRSCTLPVIRPSGIGSPLLPLKAIYIATTVQFLVIVLGAAVPSAHQWLMHISGYDKVVNYGYSDTIFFAFRGVALLGNTYAAGFFFAVTSLVALWAFRAKVIRKSSFIILLVALTGLILVNTRTGIAFLIFALVAQSFFSTGGTKRARSVLLVAIAVLSVGSLAYASSAAFRTSFDATVALSDAVGSSQAHRTFFLGGLRLIGRFPFGVGAGRVNFSRIPYGESYSPESYLLSIALDNGILFCVVFLMFYIRFWRCARRGVGDTMKPLVDGILIGVIVVSAMNMQVLESGFIFLFALLTLVSGRMAVSALRPVT